MPNEIYHRSEWGNPKAEGFGDVYFDAAATNKLYNHSDYYENSDGTDKILRDLPNKASIVLTPTAYSDGSLNTVIPPYQILPQELVTNGGFDTDSDWTKETGWTISNGVASHNGVAGAIYQINNSIISGKTYKLSLTVLNVTSGTLTPFVAGTNSNLSITQNGSYSAIVVAGSGSRSIDMYSNATFVGSIDSISIKEIQEADFDFSRGSSATRVNEKGLIESIASGLPRIDYTSGFGSLLLEPQRTNNVPYSEDFSQWTATTATVSTNQIISPDGTLNADKITINSDALSGVRLFTQINAQKYNFSCYIKKGTTSNVKLYIIQQGVSEYKIDIDLDTGTLGSIPSGITDAKIYLVGNGWYNVSCSRNFTTSASNHGVGIIAENNNGNDFYVWGGQLEQGDYATSYIPTNGSTVTRSADVANNSGNADLINSTEGVLYAEIAALTDVDGDASLRFISLSNGTSSKRITIYYFSSETFGVQLKNDGYEVTDLYIGGSVDRTQFNKIALYYSGSNLKAYLNGIEVFTNSSWIPFPDNTINTLTFTDGSLSNLPFYGKTKELAVFKEALTDAELESLTSWVSFTEMATDLEYTLE